MLSLSKKTDYALLALSHLTRTGGERAVNTKEIAEQYGIPVELLAKILQKLAKADLLTSTSGPTGGYRLARPAAEISVGSVIEVIDGPPAIIQCMKTVHSGCEQQTRCTIRAPLTRINTRIFQMLNLISLAEINRDEGEAAPIPFVTQQKAHTRSRELARNL
jgi:Rrf2 family protein